MVLLSACKTMPERTPAGGLHLTENYARIQENYTPRENIGARWWDIYESQTLDRFIETALTGNIDIATAQSRLEQAAALSRQSLADLMPTLDGTAERDTTRGDNDTPSTLSLRGAAGYEIDIFGKNRAAYNADHLLTEAALEDLRSAVVTVSASIVENWIRLNALREEEKLLHEQIETNNMVLELQHKRYAGGVAGALDVLQQKEVLARAKALLPAIQAEQEIVLQQLAVLAGQSPSDTPKIPFAPIPQTWPVPETGIPAQLLENRPDIAAAWLRLRAADWDTQAAWADRLPALSLAGTYSTTSAGLTPLIETWAFNLAASLTAPLFDGGRRQAEEQRREAIADERFIAYKETVLNAISEVENALTRNHYQTQTLKALHDQLEASRSSLEQAQISYIGGNESYLSVLNGLINVQGLERQIIQERRDLALHRVALYRAIGLRKTADLIINHAKEQEQTNRG